MPFSHGSTRCIDKMYNVVFDSMLLLRKFQRILLVIGCICGRGLNIKRPRKHAMKVN